MLGPIRDDLLDGRSFAPPGTHRVLNGSQPVVPARVGVRGGAQPPQPQQVVQPVIVLGPPGVCHRGLVFGQELLAEPALPLWIQEPWRSAAAGGRVEGGADPAVVGGVEGEAGGDDLVDAVEDVVGEVHAGGGEL